MTRLSSIRDNNLEYVNYGLTNSVRWELYDRTEEGCVYLISTNIHWGKTFQFNRWKDSDLRLYLNEFVYKQFKELGKKCLLPQTTEIVINKDNETEIVTDYITVQELDKMTTDSHYHTLINGFMARMVIKLDENRDVHIINGLLVDIGSLEPIVIETPCPNSYLGVISDEPAFEGTRVPIHIFNRYLFSNTAKLYNYTDGIMVPDGPLSATYDGDFIITDYQYFAHMSSSSFLRVEVEDSIGRTAIKDIYYKYDLLHQHPIWFDRDCYIGKGASRKFISDKWISVSFFNNEDYTVIGRVGEEEFAIDSGYTKIGMPYDFWTNLPEGRHRLDLIATNHIGDNDFTSIRYYYFDKLSQNWGILLPSNKHVINNQDFIFKIVTHDEEQLFEYKIWFYDKLMVDSRCMGEYDCHVRLSDETWDKLPLGSHPFTIELTCFNTGKIIKKTWEFEKLSDKLIVRKTVKAKKGTARIVVVYKSTGITNAEMKLLHDNLETNVVLEENTTSGELTIMKFSAEITEDINQIDWLLSIGKYLLEDEIYLEAVSFGVF